MHAIEAEENNNSQLTPADSNEFRRLADFNKVLRLRIKFPYAFPTCYPETAGYTSSIV
jgi:hypothetical protein